MNQEMWQKLIEDLKELKKVDQLQIDGSRDLILILSGYYLLEALVLYFYLPDIKFISVLRNLLDNFRSTDEEIPFRSDSSLLVISTMQQIANLIEEPLNAKSNEVYQKLTEIALSNNLSLINDIKEEIQRLLYSHPVFEK